MDIESARWDEWEARFMALAAQAETVPAGSSLKNAAHYLCLYGENGLTPEEEFAELEALGQWSDRLKKVEIETGYWQDTVLFVP